MAEKVEILVELKNDSDAKRRLNDLLQIINQLNKGADINVNVNSSSMGQAANQMSRMRSEATSLSSALTGIGGAFSTIGGALQGIGNLFSIDLLGTVERTLTAYGTILATQGFKNSISRYDIMTTYADYMQIMGVSAEKAEASLDKVNQAIQGIPVGLDTAAQEIRMFTMYLQGTGDSMDDVADKATNLTIGLERALVAGGASEAMKTTAKFEVNRLLATGSLSTARQWQALLNGLGVSGQYLKDVMGYGDLSTQDFIAKLSGKDKEISTEEFINGIAALADYEGLNKAIDIYKTTIEAGIYDLRFAMTRGFANTFTVINEVLEQETDKGIRDYIQDLRQGINDVFANIQGWIRENPEVLTMILDKFNEVMQRAKELDIGQIMLDIATEGGKLVDFFLKLYDAIPEGWFQKFFVFSTVWAGPLGRLISGVGGIFTTIGSLLRYLPALGGLLGFGGGARLSGGSILTALGGLASVAGIGGIIWEYAKVMEEIGKMDFGNWKQNIGAVLEFAGISAAAVTSLTAVGTMFGSAPQAQMALLKGEGFTLGFEFLVAGLGRIVYEFAKIAETIGNMNLANFDENMKKISTMMNWVAGFVGVSTAVSGGIVAATGGIGFLFELAGLGITEGIILEVQQIGGIILEFANVAETISNLHLTGNFDRKVESFIRAIGDIYKVFPTLGSSDVAESARYKDFFTNIGEALSSLQASADTISAMEGKLNWLNRTDGKYDDLKGKILSFAEGIGEIYATFEEAFGPTGRIEKLASGNYPIILSNMNTALTEIDALIGTMEQIDDSLISARLVERAMNTSPNNGEGFIYQYAAKAKKVPRYKAIADEVTEMLTSIKEIMDIFGGDDNSDLGRWIKSTLTNWSTSAEANSIGNLKLALDSVTQIVTIVNDYERQLSTMTYHPQGGSSVSRDGTKRSWKLNSTVDDFVENTKRFLYSIYSLFMDENGEPIMAKFANITNSGDIIGVLTNLKTAFDYDGLKGIIFNIRDMRGPLEEVVKNTVTSDLTIVLRRIVEALDVISTDDDGTALYDKAKNMNRAVSQIKEMIDTLNSMKDTIANLYSGEDSIGQKIGNLVNAMLGAFNNDKTEDFTTRIGELQAVIGSTQELFKALANTSLESLNEQLKTLADYLNNWINPWTDTLQGNLEKVADNARKARVQIQDLGTTMAYQHGHISTLNTDLDSLSGHLNGAETAARNLANALNNIPRSVNVNYNETRIQFRQPTRLPNGAAYFASGGPVGTDTVPAWLSPGEFVMRSKAVRAFGAQFMAQVNALNIPGALNALVRHYTVPQTTPVNNISNRDNHAVVNQNIYTNNPNYSYARASKYVRAL